MKIPDAVLDWLLESENPSVRYRALTELLGVPQDDPDVRQVRAAIINSKPVLKIFAKMHPDGYWLHRGVGAGVSYAMSSSTHFVLSYLAELGLNRTVDPWRGGSIDLPLCDQRQLARTVVRSQPHGLYAHHPALGLPPGGILKQSVIHTLVISSTIRGKPSSTLDRMASPTSG
jgi:hypothetical protein